MLKEGIKVFAPASVANIAVGFDILGFAIDGPGDEIYIKEGSEKGLIIKSIEGCQSKLPYDIYKNTAGYSAYRLLKHLGELDRPLEMRIHKKMPFGSGLGSSAASAAAGVFAVSEFLESGLSKQELLRFAVEGEQIADGAFHADNVAPSLLGGMILIRDNFSLDYKKIFIPHGLHVVVIYPHISILTKDSRALLREQVSFKDMIKQQGNLAAFIAAMYTSDFDLLGRCLEDNIVEPQRAHLIPNFYEMKEMAIEAGALGFSISGAGPSMFALTQNSLTASNIAQAAEKLYKSKKIKVHTYLSKINQEGTYRC